MIRYLIDANLPRRVSIWQSTDFQFVADINDEWTDSEIWSFAKADSLVIVTKDADFSHRIIASQPPPKVVHIRVGNLRLRDFVSFIEANWRAIDLAAKRGKLINVYRDRIEVVS